MAYTRKGQYMDTPKCPQTVNDAVELVLSGLSEGHRDMIRQRPRGEAVMVALHFIRNTFGLRMGGTALWAVCGTTSADGAAAVILRALWRRIRGEDDENLMAAQKLTPAEFKAIADNVMRQPSPHGRQSDHDEMRSPREP